MDSYNQLLHACENGNLEKVKKLIFEDKSIEIETCTTPFSYACAKDHLQIVKFLVLKGAIINAANNEALKYASEYKQIKTLKYLISELLKNDEKIEDIIDVLQKEHIPLAKKIILEKRNQDYGNAQPNWTNEDLGL